MKKLEILLRIIKMKHRDMKSANATGKMSLIDLLDTLLPQTSQFAKKTVSAKHN